MVQTCFVEVGCERQTTGVMVTVIARVFISSFRVATYVGISSRRCDACIDNWFIE